LFLLFKKSENEKISKSLTSLTPAVKIVISYNSDISFKNFSAYGLTKNLPFPPTYSTLNNEDKKKIKFIKKKLLLQNE